VFASYPSRPPPRRASGRRARRRRSAAPRSAPARSRRGSSVPALSVGERTGAGRDGSRPSGRRLRPGGCYGSVRRPRATTIYATRRRKSARMRSRKKLRLPGRILRALQASIHEAPRASSTASRRSLRGSAARISRRATLLAPSCHTFGLFVLSSSAAGSRRCVSYRRRFLDRRKRPTTARTSGKIGCDSERSAQCPRNQRRMSCAKSSRAGQGTPLRASSRATPCIRPAAASSRGSPVTTDQLSYVPGLAPS